jgi:ribonuclease PH
VTHKPRAIREREARSPVPAAFRRPDGRAPTVLRPFKIERGVLPNAEGSALVTMGRTRVLCAATVEDRVPPFLKGKGGGWVTAEYGMLPRSTHERTPRERQASGRSQEIQRLIGRSLRAVADLRAFGERQIVLDCDVIEADGGTRTAAINGAYVALHDAFLHLSNHGMLLGPPLTGQVAAVSVGLCAGTLCLDLAYAEDSAAQVDMNVVMTADGRFVEVQGTGENATFSDAELRALLRLAARGIRRIVRLQRRAIGDSGLLPG